MYGIVDPPKNNPEYEELMKDSKNLPIVIHDWGNKTLGEYLKPNQGHITWEEKRVMKAFMAQRLSKFQQLEDKTSGNVKGTRRFVSPEKYRDRNTPYTHKSDIYSLDVRISVSEEGSPMYPAVPVHLPGMAPDSGPTKGHPASRQFLSAARNERP
ncbi:hypothetical protein CONCODRAFT_3828 [Conidiobolus coronatus NRRL 28638]|uniref:Uncharacterized protein n=1 Tax=Conidiobolus coronatus (strain ATCC 28846 / CBS 209.66 / NRRL 28638) TaxID=796925 RepID=A0A137PDW5_CONC2|nr:hypothetical protein CONCODRAFT_3828 [Conidiobolus coronatus NRRL 28638]|eukprot:KXN73162.1 hypothetical protein CONCODRAFT_3828 [Conidiobolus coronatus NRRL 28638]